MKRTATAAILLLTTSQAFAGACPMPKFQVSDFKTADGTVDQGFPGGVSVIDADGDGDLDVMATQGFDTTAARFTPRRSMLYLNDGTGKFSRASHAALSAAIGPASGSTWADIDRDGDLDAFVAMEIGATDAFFRNLGNARFERQDLSDATKTKGGNFTASWADIDSDGDLDLYVGGPTLEPPGPSLVYRNDKGSFVRVEGSPIEHGMNNPGAALWADLDNDGDQDLLLPNSDIARRSEMTPAPLEHTVVYRNDGSWKFTHATGSTFEDAAFPALAAALGDVDNDGDLDVLLGLYASGKNKRRDRLFLNTGNALFVDAKNVVLPEHSELQFAVAMADFNLDGNLDLMTASYNAPIDVLSGDGTGNFVRADDRALAQRKRSHASVAIGDLNGDGRLDAVIGSWAETATGEAMTLLMNETPSCGGWTEIALQNAEGAPNPPGARVTLVTKASNGKQRRQLREASAQTGMRSQNGNAFLFAIPPGEQAIAAEVLWPDGQKQTVSSIVPNGRSIVRPSR